MATQSALAKKTTPKKAATKKTAPKKAAAKKSTSKKSSAKKSPAQKSSTKAATKKAAPKKWSAPVTAKSDAMDLEPDVFKSKDPKKIAESVKQSAEKSTRKKAGPFQSAMSMINFYENRGGKNLSAAQIKVLDKAKEVAIMILCYR